MPIEALLVVGEVRVTTHGSVWFVRPSTYLRAPRTEGPRAPLLDLDGASRDGLWHDHAGAWLITEGDERRLNVLPAGRPLGSRGLVSGPIVSIRGA